uniref:SUI1 domain-containing protein n=1 Tax=Panagrellus redivivus TaxID=6233 RepID=A0A7E4W827_PANRE
MLLPHSNRPRNLIQKSKTARKYRSTFCCLPLLSAYIFFIISSPIALIMNTEIEYPLTVRYCSVCTMPLEYCEYSDNKACQKQLANCKQEYKALPTVQLLTSSYKLKLDPYAAKRKQARKTPEGKNAKNDHNNVKNCITRNDKVKEATHVLGLEAFGVDLKEACKVFTKKFGTRCNVVRETGELFIHGNFVCQMFDLIPEKFSNISIRDIVDKGVRDVASDSDEE